MFNRNNLSLLGIGIMRWPNRPDYKKSRAFIDLAYNSGVNYYEACAFYNGGNCERIISSLLKDYPRDTYNLCDKMPIQGYIMDGMSPEDIFQQQLKNCNTQYFDYYLIQCVDRTIFDIIKDSHLIEYLDGLKREGIIRNLGFSFHDDEVWLKKYLDLYDWDCVQLQLNYVDWFINNHENLYNILMEKDIPIFVMGALKGGQLSYNLPKEAIKLLNNENPDVSIGSWGMNFVGSLPGVKVVLTGTTEIDELQDNINTFSEVKYTDDYINQKIFKDVASIYANHSYIPCTGCKYCEPHCPRKISISKIFTLYNKIISGYNDMDKQEYLNIHKDPKDGMNACQGCGQCNRYCPQKINIPQTILNTGMYYR